MDQMRILKCVQTGHVQITGGDAMIILCASRFVTLLNFLVRICVGNKFADM